MTEQERARAAGRVRAVVFDLDGTLVDSLDDIAAAMNVVLRTFSFAEHPRDAYRAFVGEGVEALVRRALPTGSDDEPMVRRALGLMREAYEQHLDRQTRPYQGIPELLETLTDRGVLLAVLSNKVEELTQQVVERCFDASRFTFIRGARPDVPRKPDPTAALQLVEASGIPAAQWLFLGDTHIDLATARAAGMTSVGVTWGFRPDEMRTGEADHVVDHPAEVVPLLI